MSDPMLRLAKERCANLVSVKLVTGDMTALQLRDNSFDAAVAVQSVAYVPEAGRALAEIARVLRPGGRAVILGSELINFSGSTIRF